MEAGADAWPQHAALEYVDMSRTDTASLVIDAPQDRVYRALIDPEALVKWVPPGNMTGSIEHLDAWPGGSYRMVLTNPEGSGSWGKSTENSDIVVAKFIELIPGQRVTYAVSFEIKDPGHVIPMVMSWDLIPVDGGIRVRVTAENVPEMVSEQDHAAGLASSLEKLALYLND